MQKCVGLVCVAASITWLGACGFPRPTPLGGLDASDDGGLDSNSICTANQALRCDASDLVRCNGEGTAEVNESCSLGCNATDLRCNDVKPSNDLAPYLDMTGVEPDLDLGTKAAINTDDGTVVVDGKPIVVNHATMAQASAPTIQIFIVHSLTTADVTITGSNALAIVSNGDVKVGGSFAASAIATTPGSGGFNDGACKGGDGVSMLDVGILAGSGGGGFGHSGGLGGNAMGGTPTATANGGAAGTPTGNLTLVPLRGGCDGGGLNLSGSVLKGGAGGGAIQLVSRTKITVSGAVAANGSSFIAGGSGGGILLEAPLVEVPGSVVANGGGGAGVALSSGYLQRKTVDWMRSRRSAAAHRRAVPPAPVPMAGTAGPVAQVLLAAPATWPGGRTPLVATAVAASGASGSTLFPSASIRPACSRRIRPPEPSRAADLPRALGIRGSRPRRLRGGLRSRP